MRAITRRKVLKGIGTAAALVVQPGAVTQIAAAVPEVTTAATGALANDAFVDGFYQDFVHTLFPYKQALLQDFKLGLGGGDTRHLLQVRYGTIQNFLDVAAHYLHSLQCREQDVIEARQKAIERVKELMQEEGYVEEAFGDIQHLNTKAAIKDYLEKSMSIVLDQFAEAAARPDAPKLRAVSHESFDVAYDIFDELSLQLPENFYDENGIGSNITRADLEFMIEERFFKKHNFRANYFTLSPGYEELLNVVGSHPLKRASRVHNGVNYFEEKFNWMESPLPDLTVEEDDEIINFDEDLIGYRGLREDHATIRFPVDFLRRTKDHSLSEILELMKPALKQEMLEESKTLVRFNPVRVDSDGGLDGGSFPVGVLGMWKVEERNLVTSKGVTLLRDNLSQIFSSAVSLYNSGKCFYVVANWDATDDDLKILDTNSSLAPRALVYG